MLDENWYGEQLFDFLIQKFRGQQEELDKFVCKIGLGSEINWKTPPTDDTWADTNTYIKNL